MWIELRDARAAAELRRHEPFETATGITLELPALATPAPDEVVISVTRRLLP